LTTIAQSSEGSDTKSDRRSLSEAMASLRTRTTKITLEGVFVTLGAICLPVGIVVIVLGWYGAAHTGHVYEQNDYLISGGLLGLGLIFIGGFLYFGYWLTRQVRATETGNQQTQRALARLSERLDGVVTTGGRTGARVLVVTELGSMVHTTTCPIVVDKPVRIVDRVDPNRNQLCTVCNPLD
jgi:hypothetical protein